jgi:hypothetical protein
METSVMPAAADAQRIGPEDTRWHADDWCGHEQVRTGWTVCTARPHARAVPAAAERSWRSAAMAARGTADALARRLEESGLVVVGTDRRRSVHSRLTSTAPDARIRETRPDLVWVGLSTPKREPGCRRMSSVSGCRRYQGRRSIRHPRQDTEAGAPGCSARDSSGSAGCIATPSPSRRYLSTTRGSCSRSLVARRDSDRPPASQRWARPNDRHAGSDTSMAAAPALDLVSDNRSARPGRSSTNPPCVPEIDVTDMFTVAANQWATTEDGKVRICRRRAATTSAARRISQMTAGRPEDRPGSPDRARIQMGAVWARTSIET